MCRAHFALITSAGTCSDATVGRSAASGQFSVVVTHGDLVAEEPCRAGAGVGDQRLGLGQFQLEVFLQELGEATFDLLGFGLWSGEPEQDVVGLCRAASYAE
jgi:hypothetical protein